MDSEFENREGKCGGKMRRAVKGLKSILNEDSPPSDFQRKSSILDGTKGSQLVLEGKGRGRAGEEEESLA